MTKGAVIAVAAMLIGLMVGLLINDGDVPQDHQGKEVVEQAKAELPVPEEIMKLAGVIPARGEGIRITVEDSKMRRKKQLPTERLLVHEQDLMLITNELFAAGAEAISINGQRFVATTEIRCVGPAIRINGKNTVPPYIIDALGDPEILKESVLMMGGVVDVLAAEKLIVKIDMMHEFELPAYGKFKLDKDVVAPVEK